MARILLVDDSADIRHLLGTILKDEGHDVAVASDGVQAIEAIKNGAPDLMILDIMMPRMDGYGVLKEMRDGGIKEDVKILVLTAKAAEADWVAWLQAGSRRLPHQALRSRRARRGRQHTLEDGPGLVEEAVRAGTGQGAAPVPPRVHVPELLITPPSLHPPSR